MTTFYVNANAGINSSAGTKPRLAVADPHKAFLLAERTPGADKIIIAPGTYKPFEIDSSHVTVVARDGVVIDGQGKYSYGILVRGNHVSLKGFEIEDVAGAAVTIKFAHHVTVADFHIHDSEEGIFATGSDYLKIVSNIIHDVDSHRSGTQAVSIHNPKSVSGYANWEYRIQFVGNHVYDTGSPGTADDFAFIVDNPQNRDYRPGILVSDNLIESNAKGILFFNVYRFGVFDNILNDNGYAGIATRNANGDAKRNVVISDDDFTFRQRVKDSRVAYDDNTAWNTHTKDAGTPVQMPLAPAEHWHVYEPDIDALRHDWLLDH